jgi:hypothetical protein
MDEVTYLAFPAPYFRSSERIVTPVDQNNEAYGCEITDDARFETK